MDTGKKELGAFPKNLHKCNTKGKKIAMLLWSFFLREKRNGTMA